MSKSALEQVKELASLLAVDERLELLKFVADLPNSGITYQSQVPIELATPHSVPLTIENKKKALGLLELRTIWDCVIENGEVIYSLQGREVFRGKFQVDNYAAVSFDLLKDSALILTLPDDARHMLREGLRRFFITRDIEPTDELLDQSVIQAIQLHSQGILKQSIVSVSNEIAANLDKAVTMVFAKIVGASGFSIANDLRERLDMSETKISATEIKAIVYAAEWEHLKTVVGITHGGSDPRVDVSDEQCIRLATDYPGLLEHWRQVGQMRRKRSRNWRDHAKLDVEDTPDDLLDRLDDDLPQEGAGDYPNIPSALAHEHAARRAGIPDNEYGLSQLGRLRRRGDKKRGQSRTQNE